MGALDGADSQAVADFVNGTLERSEGQSGFFEPGLIERIMNELFEALKVDVFGLTT